MTGFEQLYVSHHQFLVRTGTRIGDLPLFTVGDRLVQLTGDGQLTVLTGPHSAEVPVRVTLGRPGPLDGWDAASEATLFCDRGKLSVASLGDKSTVSVSGLMGDIPPALSGLAVQAGLVRVRVHARNRDREDERYEVFAWPVTADEGVRTIEADAYGAARGSDSARAATWAAELLLARANPSRQEERLRRRSGEPPWRYPRVEVRRDLAGDLDRLGLTPDGDDLVLPIGDAELRVRPEGTVRASVRWTRRPGATVTIPDTEPSTVELSAAGLVHRGVRAEDAVPLGLLWEYLLRRTGGEAHPWEAEFAAASAEAARRAAESRRHREAEEVRRWGGRMPSPRIRSLTANTHLLWSLDPDLVEALAAATHDQQRAVARWSARRACAVAGLDTVDWIDDALAAVERDAPPVDPAAAFNRLLSDPRVPTTLVHGRGSQQALALSAVLAAANPDPLVAAVDAVGAAARAHGGNEFLLAAHAFLNTSSKP